MDYKVITRAYIKKDIKEGYNPLFTNYVGHIGRKPLYGAEVPLESMGEILISSERGMMEVTS
jgi:hypothetical protein